MTRAAFIVAVSVSVLSTLAHTEEVRAEPPREAVMEVDPIDIPPEHDPLERAFDLPSYHGGFYLRPSIAIGAHNTRLGKASWESGDGRSANGFGTGFGLDIGGFVRPWLALHLDTTIGVLWNADLESDIAVVGQGEDEARVVAYGFAPAATFFLAHGFYLKPAFGVGLATVQYPGNDYTTDPGFYMNLLAGKDLYVHNNFSVGLQFQIIYMTLGADSEADEARVRQFLFGLSFGFDGR